jgi:hypothetical protein
VVGNPGTKKPDKNIGNKIASKKDNPSYSFIKEKQDGSQEKQGHCIRNEMHQASVNHGGGEDSYDPFKRAGFDPKPRQVNPVKKLQAECHPHDKNQPEGNNRTPEKTVPARHED